MAILESIVAVGLPKILERAGGGLLAKVAKSGRVGEVIAEIAKEAGLNPTPDAIRTMAKEDPAAFADVVQSVEASNLARWEALAAETGHASMFVSGARPASIWACVLVIGYTLTALVVNWAVSMIGVMGGWDALPALQLPPPVVWETLVWLLPLLYGLRTLEGIGGSKRNSL